MTLTAGMLATPQFTNDTDANTTSSTNDMPKKETVMKYVKNDVLFTIDDGPSKYMIDIAKTLDDHQYR